MLPMRWLGSGWVARALASVALSLQHAVLPLVFDAPYLLWRAVMYLPFALYIGLVVKLRPTRHEYGPGQVFLPKKTFTGISRPARSQTSTTRCVVKSNQFAIV